MAIKILVAGDSSKNVEFVKTLLGPDGHQIIPVNGLALALFLSHKNFPHLIICDRNMIDGSGLDFMREAQADPELSAIPLVFLASGECDMQVKAQALALGAREIFQQPVEPAEFLRAVGPYLHERDEDREPDTPE